MISLSQGPPEKCTVKASSERLYTTTHQVQQQGIHPLQTSVQSQGNIGSENAANTNSERAPSQPGTTKKGVVFADPTVFPLQRTEFSEQNEQGIRPTEVIAHRLQFEPEHGEQVSYDMSVDGDDGKSAEMRAPYSAPLDPVRHLLF